MCFDHWSDKSPRMLGTGYGQMLVRYGEETAAVAEALGVVDLVRL